MGEERFSETLRQIVPPAPDTDGWLDGARRRRRRRQGVAAGVVGVVVLALAVPVGINLTGASIDAMPAAPDTTAATAAELCRDDNVLAPSVDVADPAEFTRGVGCLGHLLGEDQHQVELPGEVVTAAATSLLADSAADAEGQWSYDDSSLLFITADGGAVELWQIRIMPGELTYLWKRDGQLMVWTPAPAVADLLREHLGVE